MAPRPARKAKAMTAIQPTVDWRLRRRGAGRPGPAGRAAARDDERESDTAGRAPEVRGLPGKDARSGVDVTLTLPGTPSSPADDTGSRSTVMPLQGPTPELDVGARQKSSIRRRQAWREGDIVWFGPQDPVRALPAVARRSFGPCPTCASPGSRPDPPPRPAFSRSSPSC